MISKMRISLPSLTRGGYPKSVWPITKLPDISGIPGFGAGIMMPAGPVGAGLGWGKLTASVPSKVGRQMHLLINKIDQQLLSSSDAHPYTPF